MNGNENLNDGLVTVELADAVDFEIPSENNSFLKEFTDRFGIYSANLSMMRPGRCEYDSRGVIAKKSAYGVWHFPVEGKSATDMSWGELRLPAGYSESQLFDDICNQ